MLLLNYCTCLTPHDRTTITPRQRTSGITGIRGKAGFSIDMPLSLGGPPCVSRSNSGIELAQSRLTDRAEMGTGKTSAIQ